MGFGKGRELNLIKELHFPDSLGLLYSAFTYFTGFKVNSGEYKLMGLAPYGKPIYKDVILKELVDVKEDGSLRLNLSYFDFLGGLQDDEQAVRGAVRRASQEAGGGDYREGDGCRRQHSGGYGRNHHEDGPSCT